APYLRRPVAAGRPGDRERRVARGFGLRDGRDPLGRNADLVRGAHPVLLAPVPLRAQPAAAALAAVLRSDPWTFSQTSGSASRSRSRRPISGSAWSARWSAR